MADLEALKKLKKTERTAFTKAYNQVEELIGLQGVDIVELESELNVLKSKVDRLEFTHSSLLELLPEGEFETEFQIIEDYRDKAIRIETKAKRIINAQTNNCSKDIVVKDIRKILKEDPVKIKTLLEKSRKDYLERNRENIYYCPAPDCLMFFYKEELSINKLNCPLCRNDICPKCNVIYHGGYTCDMYQNSKRDPDFSFKVWQKTTTQCKQCPRCKTAIEKVAGCNRMRCSSCNGSFCWICVKEFRTDQEVYNHIHSAHRGMLFL